MILLYLFQRTSCMQSLTPTWTQRRGKYLPPDMIIARQGGWGSEEAVRRGTNIISTCCRLGGDFMSWNSQSTGWDCLLLKKKFEDIYKQKWLDMYRSRVTPLFRRVSANAEEQRDRST